MLDSLLQEVAFAGDVKQLSKYLHLEKTRDERGFTLLHQATSAGNIECIQFLLNNGFRIDTPNSRFSALHIACLDGKMDVVKVFIQQRVNLNLLESGGHSCLHLAIMRGHFDIVKLLLESGIQLEFKYENLLALLVPKTILYRKIQPIKKLLIEKAKQRAILVDLEITKILPIACKQMPPEIIEFIRKYILKDSWIYLVKSTTKDTSTIGPVEKKSLLSNSKIKHVFELFYFISK